MVKKCVRVYIEGGSPSRLGNSDFRRSWKKFLSEIHLTARQHGYNSLEIVRGLSRHTAYDMFVNRKNGYPNDLCVLLVDSETAAPNSVAVWDVVKHRPGDHWERPSWASENHLYLMAQSVETWIVTDPDALAKFFKKGFIVSKLPKDNLEARSKEQIEHALTEATKGSSKGCYRHAHANEIIEFVSPNRVKSLYHGNRLFDGLCQLITS